MKRLIKWGIAGLALYGIANMTGCSAEQPTKPNVAALKTGTLGMELETVSASGKVYRLRQATFLVDTLSEPFPLEGNAGFPVSLDAGGSALPTGPAMDGGGFGGIIGAGGATGSGGSPFGGAPDIGGAPNIGGAFPTNPTTVVLSSETDPTKTVLETFLQPSEYEIQLVNGWFIEQVDQLLGTSAAVPATLESSSIQVFDIESNQETFVQFNFDVDGHRVSFGPPGRLIVGIGITETGGQGFCGDGIANGNEACDGGDFRGNTCASETFGFQPLGFLQCTPFCTLDTSACFGEAFPDGGFGGFSGAGGGGPVFIDGGSAGVSSTGGTAGSLPDAGPPPPDGGGFFGSPF